MSKISKEQNAQYRQNFLSNHPGYLEAHRKAGRDRIRTRRRVLLVRFGTRCGHCGFSDSRALQIDHRNGDGFIERRKYKSSVTFYNMLLKMSEEELHSKYQLLCANCNWIKCVENQEHMLRKR